MRTQWLAWLGAAVLAIATIACSSEVAPKKDGDPAVDGEADGNADTNADGQADGTADSNADGTADSNVDPSQFDPKVGGPDCGFDEDQQGKIIGKHIKNFGLKTAQKEAYWLHSSCGTDKKVVWLILGTGW